jgi:hypothetical protein
VDPISNEDRVSIITTCRIIDKVRTTEQMWIVKQAWDTEMEEQVSKDDPTSSHEQVFGVGVTETGEPVPKDDSTSSRAQVFGVQSTETDV